MTEEETLRNLRKFHSKFSIYLSWTILTNKKMHFFVGNNLTRNDLLPQSQVNDASLSAGYPINLPLSKKISQPNFIFFCQVTPAGASPPPHPSLCLCWSRWPFRLFVSPTPVSISVKTGKMLDPQKYQMRYMLYTWKRPKLTSQKLYWWTVKRCDIWSRISVTQIRLKCKKSMQWQCRHNDT